MPRQELASQIHFGYLSVPYMQSDDARAQEAMNNNAFSCSGSAKSPKSASIQGLYVPVNYISPEVYALLAAAEASATRRAESGNADADCMMPSGNRQGASPEITMESVYDPRSYAAQGVAPPKKYYRTFWKSISQRLLLRRAGSARPSS